MKNPTTPILGKQCIHKKSGKVYLALFNCKFKDGEIWKDAVAYSDPETFALYTRLKDDFDSSFCIVETILEDTQCC